MGDTQSAQREDKQDAAAAAEQQQQQQQQQQPQEEEEERGTVDDGGETEEIEVVEAQNLKNDGTIKGTADQSLVEVNGHREDEINSQEEDVSETENLLKETHKKDDDEITQLEINDMDAKRNDINNSFLKFFSNLGLKVTVKKGSSEPEENVEAPNLTANPIATETASKNDAQENNDSITAFSQHDVMSEDAIEKAERMATAIKEEVEFENTDAEIILFVGDQQHEVTTEEEQQSASPESPDDEIIQSPIKRFFSTGIFSGLRKKKKLAEEDAARKELEVLAKKETLETTEQSVQDRDQDPEAVSPAEEETQSKEEKEALEVVDERKMSVETEMYSPQEKEKAQASPLKMIFSGSSLKRVSKASRSRRSSDARLSDSGEQVKEQIPSAKSTENQNENPEEAPKEEESAWASFKKLLTPKKRIKKSSVSNEESQAPCASEEVKQVEKEQLADHSTEEGRKRKDSLVSWEAVLCGSGRRRSRKTSDSEDETPQAGSGSKNCTVERNKRAESPYDSEPGSAWNSLKRMVTPKRKSRDEGESLRDNVQSDDELPRNDSFLSIKKLLPGQKTSKSEEKQIEVNKDVASDDEDSETPAVVPLSEYGMEETDICIQTEPILEIQSAAHEDEQLQDDFLGEVAPPSPSPVPKEPDTAEEPDDISESISEHHLLSDIPEEGIITDTMATPVLVVEEVPTDETIAEEPIEITSEAVTAPEPTSDITPDDETEMISAVSQLSSQSSKTSGNTTPIQANYDIMETDKVLLQVVETISPSPQTEPLVAEEVLSQKLAGCVSQEPCEAFEKNKSNVLERHRRSDATAFKTGLNVEEIDAINEVAAKSMRECVTEMNGFIPSEFVHGVASDKFDTVVVSVDEIQEATIKKSEDTINELKMMDESLPFVENSSENLVTPAFEEALPEEDQIVIDVCARDTAPQAESKTISSEDECNATRVTSENQDEVLRSEALNVCEAEIKCSITDQTQAEDKHEVEVEVEKRNELLEEQVFTLDSEGTVASHVIKETPVCEMSSNDGHVDEVHAAETGSVKEKEAAEMVETTSSNTEKTPVQTLTKEVELVSASFEEIIQDMPEQSTGHLTKECIDTLKNQQTEKTEHVSVQEVLQLPQVERPDLEEETDVKSLQDMSKSTETASDGSIEESNAIAEVSLHPITAVETKEIVTVQEWPQDTLEGHVQSREKQETSAVILEVGKEDSEKEADMRQHVEEQEAAEMVQALPAISQEATPRAPSLEETVEDEPKQETERPATVISEPDREQPMNDKDFQSPEVLQSVQDPTKHSEELVIQQFEKEPILEISPEAEKEQSLDEINLEPSAGTKTTEVETSLADQNKKERRIQSFHEEILSDTIPEMETVSGEPKDKLDHSESNFTFVSTLETVEQLKTPGPVHDTEEGSIQLCEETFLKDTSPEEERVATESEQEPVPLTSVSHESVDTSQIIQQVDTFAEQHKEDTQLFPDENVVPEITSQTAQLDSYQETSLKEGEASTKTNEKELEDENVPKQPFAETTADRTQTGADVSGIVKRVEMVQAVQTLSLQSEEGSDPLFERKLQSVRHVREEADKDILKEQTLVLSQVNGDQEEHSKETQESKKPERTTVLSDVHMEQEDALQTVQFAEVLHDEHDAGARPEATNSQLLKDEVTSESSQLVEANPVETLLGEETNNIFAGSSEVLQFNIILEMKDVEEEVLEQVTAAVAETSPEPEIVGEEPEETKVLPDVHLEQEDASKTVQESEAKPEETLLGGETNEILAETSEILQISVIPETEEDVGDKGREQVQKEVAETSHERELVGEEPEGTTDLSDVHMEQEDGSKNVQEKEVLDVEHEVAASPEAHSPQLGKDVEKSESSQLVETKPDETELGETIKTRSEISEVLKISVTPETKDAEKEVREQVTAPVADTSPQLEIARKEPEGTAVLSDVSKTVQVADVLHVECKAEAGPETNSQQLCEEVETPESSQLVEAKPGEILLEEETNKILPETAEVLQINAIPEIKDVEEDNMVQVPAAVAETSPESGTLKEDSEETTVLSDVNLEQEDACQTVKVTEVLQVQHDAAASPEATSLQLLKVVMSESSQSMEAKPEETLPEGETNKKRDDTVEVLQMNVIPEMRDVQEEVLEHVTAAVVETSPEPEIVAEEPEETKVLPDIHLEQEDASETVHEVEVLHVQQEAAAIPEASSPHLPKELVFSESSQLVEAKSKETLLEGETTKILAETSEVFQLSVIPETKDVEEEVIEQVTAAVVETSPEPETVFEEPEEKTDFNEVHLEQEDGSKTVQEKEVLHVECKAAASPEAHSPQLGEDVETSEISQLVETKPEERLLEGETTKMLAETSEVLQLSLIPEMTDVEEKNIEQVTAAVAETSPEAERVHKEAEETEALPDGHLEQEEASKTVQVAEVLHVEHEVAASPKTQSPELCKDVETSESSQLVETKPEEAELGVTIETLPEISEVLQVSVTPETKDAEKEVREQVTEPVADTSPQLEIARKEPEGTAVLSDVHLEQEDVSKTVQVAEVLHVECKAEAGPETNSQQLCEEVETSESSQLVEAKPGETLLEGETNKILTETAEVLQTSVIPETEDVEEEVIEQVTAAVAETSPEPEIVSEEPEGTAVLSDVHLEQEDASETVQEVEVLHVEQEASPEASSPQLPKELVISESSQLVEAKSKETLLEGETTKILPETAEVLQLSVIPEMTDVEEEVIEQVTAAVVETSPEAERVHKEAEETEVLPDVHLDQEEASKTVQVAEVLHVEHEVAASPETQSPELCNDVETSESSQLVETKPEEAELGVTIETLPEISEVLQVSVTPETKDAEKEVREQVTEPVADTSPQLEIARKEPEGTAVLSDVHLEQKDVSKTLQEVEALHVEQETAASPGASSPQLPKELVISEISQSLETKTEKTVLQGETNKTLSETSEVLQISVIPETKDVEEEVIEQVTAAVAETSPEPETVCEEHEEKTDFTDVHLEQEDGSKTDQEEKVLHSEHEAAASQEAPSPQLGEDFETSESSHLVETKAEEIQLEGETTKILAETSEVLQFSLIPEMTDAEEKNIEQVTAAVAETSPEVEIVSEEPEGTAVLSDVHLEQEDASETVQEVEVLHVEQEASPEASSQQLPKELVISENSQLVEAKSKETLLEGETTKIFAETSEVLQISVIPETKDVEEEVIEQVTAAVAETSPEPETVCEEPEEKTDFNDVHLEQEDGSKTVQKEEVLHGECKAEACPETNSQQLCEEVETSESSQLVEAKSGETFLEGETIKTLAKTSVEQKINSTDETKDVPNEDIAQEQKVMECIETEVYEKFDKEDILKVNDNIVNSLTETDPQKAELEQENSTTKTLEGFQSFPAVCASTVNTESNAFEELALPKETPAPDPTNATPGDEQQHQVTVAASQMTDKQERESDFTGFETKEAEISDERQQEVQLVAMQVSTEQEQEAEMRRTEKKTAGVTDEPEQSVHVSVVQVGLEQEKESELPGAQPEMVPVEHAIVAQAGMTEISREIANVCHDTLETLECASANAGIEEETVTQDNQGTVEEVDEELVSYLDLQQDEVNIPEAGRRPSNAAESETSELEYDTAGEESQDERIPLSSDTTEQQLSVDGVQKHDSRKSSERPVHQAEAEAVAPVEQEKSKDSINPEVPDLISEHQVGTAGIRDEQESESAKQNNQVQLSLALASPSTQLVLPPISIFSPSHVESVSSLSLEAKLNIQHGQPKEPESLPPATVSTSTLETKDGSRAKEQKEPTSTPETGVQAMESLDQGACAVSAPLDADSVTSEVQATQITEPDNAAELQEPPCAQEAEPEEPTEQKGEEPDQDVWMDAEEVISTREETVGLFCDVEETGDPMRPQEQDDKAAPVHEAELQTDAEPNEEVFETEMGKTVGVCEVDSESEDFAAALEDLERENTNETSTRGMMSV